MWVRACLVFGMPKEGKESLETMIKDLLKHIVSPEEQVIAGIQRDAPYLYLVVLETLLLL